MPNGTWMTVGEIRLCDCGFDIDSFYRRWTLDPDRIDWVAFSWDKQSRDIQIHSGAMITISIIIIIDIAYWRRCVWDYWLACINRAVCMHPHNTCNVHSMCKGRSDEQIPHGNWQNPHIIGNVTAAENNGASSWRSDRNSDKCERTHLDIIQWLSSLLLFIQ